MTLAQVYMLADAENRTQRQAEEPVSGRGSVYDVAQLASMQLTG